MSPRNATLQGSSGSFSIASCVYAPGGDWARAGDVQAGDYAIHRFDNDYQPKVHDPEAALSDRPTELESSMGRQWDRRVFDQFFSEQVATERVAQENGVTEQEVKDAYFKCMDWTMR